MNKGKCFSMANMGQRKKSDFYQTPYSMTQHLLDREKFEGSILEPASGDGAIVKVLRDNEYEIEHFDINKSGVDFLELDEDVKYDNIITNPPFSLAFEFIQKAKKIYNKTICMLLPLSYLHGQHRYENRIFEKLKTVYVFTRYPLLTDTVREDGKYNTGMMVYAWFVWKWPWKGKPYIEWINNNNDIIRKNNG